MLNQVTGTLTICLCGILFLFAWRRYRQFAVKESLVFIIAAGAVLRIFVASDLYLHEWDERFHALVAKNLMEHPLRPMLYADPALPYDYRQWTLNHIWLHKLPVPLWIMAGSMKIFGIHEWPLRLPTVIFSTLAILLTYHIGSHLFDKKIGLLAAFFHSIHGLIIELTGGRVATDHIDVFFLCLIETSIFFGILYIQRKKLIFSMLGGIFMGLALLTKWLPALIILPVLVCFALQNRRFSKLQVAKQLLFPTAMALIVAAPWQIYIHARFPAEAQWESQYNWLHFTQTIEGHGGSFFYHFGKMRILWGELIYLPLAWFVYRTVKKKDLNMVGLFVWVFVPYLFLTFAKTKMQAYTLFVAPAIFLILAWHIMILAKKPLYYNRILSSAILVLLILLPVRYTLERTKPFQHICRNPAWSQELRLLGKQDWPDKTVIFNVERPIEAMFYGNFTAYPTIPDEAQVEELVNRGYQVFIKDGTGIEARFGARSDIKIIWQN